MGKKPRKNKMDPKRIFISGGGSKAKKDKDDWSFEEFARSKPRRR